MLQYPSDLQTMPYPAIRFTSTGGASIYLPAPGSLEFEDAAVYDDAELGYKGKKTLDTAEALSGGGGGMFSRGMSIAKGVLGDIFDSTNIKAGAASMIPGAAGTAAGIASGTVLNKNITSEFTGVGTRGFSFSFNMIPYNEADAKAIKDIVFTFRKGIYPEGTDFALKYPPKWKIEFTNTNSYIPGIGETYLERVSTSYNSTSSIWRSDGAPLETSITVTFKETKAYTLKEIEKLG